MLRYTFLSINNLYRVKRSHRKQQLDSLKLVRFLQCIVRSNQAHLQKPEQMCP